MPKCLACTKGMTVAAWCKKYKHRMCKPRVTTPTTCKRAKKIAIVTSWSYNRRTRRNTYRWMCVSRGYGNQQRFCK
jgi:hypothetical protein